MAFDGLFIHYLLNEIKVNIENKKIYKIISINDNEYCFNLSSKTSLLISVNPSHAHIRLTNKQYIHSNSLLSTYFKKHIEGGTINSITQYNNDRLIKIEITSTDDLGYFTYFKIYLELMGKNSNLIITDKNDIILEAVRKSFLTDEHVIKTGIKYIPMEDNKINPFMVNEFTDNLQGLSKHVITEINSFSLKEVLSRITKPCLIHNDKYIFYCFDLLSIEGERQYFNTLSELLEYYYEFIQKNTNDSIDLLNTKKYLEREIDKLENKLEKQNIELINAGNNEKIEKYANLLMANIHNIKPYCTSIKVLDYENNNEEITIPINPKLKPSENIEFYFNRIKKNKRTLVALANTIAQTKEDILYYKDNLAYLDYSKAGDLKEIMVELGLRKPAAKNLKPHISKYIDNNGNIYMYGKNNIQNNYLTHTLASKEDYFFHVKSVPGSHVILRGELNEDTIQIASNIAAYYSKASTSIHVCVDYTQVKWIKKVKGTKGSFVIYTHEKMAFSDPSIEFINSKVKPAN